MKKGYYLVFLSCIFLLSFGLNVSQVEATGMESEKNTVFQSEEITDKPSGNMSTEKNE